MIVSENKYCCGCRSCEYSCPTHAIKMVQDEEGFYKPLIDLKLCINCGKCSRICPALERKGAYEDYLGMYAATNCDKNVVERSSSGGMFTVFAEYILDCGGSVYGCILDDNLKPVMTRIDNKDNLDKIRRSKYVQSDTKDTYLLVKKDLENGGQVLYTGLPCQIAGLRSFLGKRFDNLFCIDLICHGVPSSDMFADNIAYWEAKMGEKAESYEFRLKPDWVERIKNEKCYHFFLKGETGKSIFKPYFYDAYYEAFYNFKSYNEMCYHCNYACKERVGDITIGDYHWAENHHSELKKKHDKDMYAISCLLVNSEQGERLLSEVKGQLELYPTKFEWVAERNKNLLRPTIRPSVRDSIYKDIEKKGYKKWAKHYYCSEAFLKHIKGINYIFRVKNKIVSFIQKGKGN